MESRVDQVKVSHSGDTRNYESVNVAAAPEDTGRRYPSRNRVKVERIDPSGSGQSYDKALLQYMCMAQIVDQQK